MNNWNALVKRLFPAMGWWPQVSRRTLRSDLAAGLTGAIIVLPQGVAFAMIAGLPPEYGLYTAIVPAIIAALFGSSHHLVSGPTTAISIVLFTTISPLVQTGSATYIEMVLTITFLAGLFQLALGVARLGALVNFVSHSVVVGFTAGAALLIGTSQLSNFLGVPGSKRHAFSHVWVDLIEHLSAVNFIVVAIVLFFVVKAYNHWKSSEAGDAAPTEVELLTEIRDSLRHHKEHLLRAAYVTIALDESRVTNYLAQQIIEAAGKLPDAAKTEFPAKSSGH